MKLYLRLGPYDWREVDCEFQTLAGAIFTGLLSGKPWMVAEPAACGNGLQLIEEGEPLL